MEILMTGLSASNRAKCVELGKFIISTLTKRQKSYKMSELYDICKENYTEGFSQVRACAVPS